jgi:RNA polymerase sigma-70 factor (ECF subfamily)
MPEPFRETLVLRELEELSYREIAEATGAPIGTVMSRLARGREMLAALILDGGNIDQKGAMNA